MPADTNSSLSVSRLQQRVDELAAELRARTADHEEALQREAAVAEVLQVISSSLGELAPVFDTMLERALRLCEAPCGHFRTFDGELLHLVASRGVPDAYAEALRTPVRPYAGNQLGRILRGEQVVVSMDVADDEAYRAGDPLRRAFVDLGGARSVVTVALAKDKRLLGTLTVYRQEVSPFSDKHIALLQNFAAQAVIAMENARLLTEQREALEQQTATAEVLEVINSSPGDLGPVFEAVLKKALQLCEAAFGVFWTYDGAQFHASALLGVPQAFADFATSGPHEPGQHNAHGRALRGETVMHIEDASITDAYQSGDPLRRALVDFGGARTSVGIALRKDDVLLGVLILYRKEVRPFTDRHIALLQNFANQAVIAMENARLLSEQREALEQQTATADILGVISRSPTDAQPVFDAIARNAHQLCDAVFCSVIQYDGERLHIAALQGFSPDEERAIRSKYPVRADDPSVLSTRVVTTGRAQHIEDILVDEHYDQAHASHGGFRRMLGVPMLRDGKPIGVIDVAWQGQGTTPQAQIDLLTTFAAQAVIAIENTRLFSELRERTDDLTESLEYQTATSEVLEVISRSTSDLQPVLDTMLAAALRLCDVQTGGVAVRRGDNLHYIATSGHTSEFAQFLRNQAFPINRSNAGGRAVLQSAVVHIPDIEVEPGYTFSETQRLGRVRTMLSVPLLRQGEPVGVITMSRTEVQPFTERQIALVRTFADQAVIAMENTRLLSELRERTDDLTQSLEYQTAISELLEIISRSTSDVQPVLDTVLASAGQLCETTSGAVAIRGGDIFRQVASMGVSPELVELLRSQVYRIDGSTAIGRVALSKNVVHIADAQADQNYSSPTTEVGGIRTVLGVPLLREGEVIGVIVLVRDRVLPFSERQVALVKTFADQAVIAMENARLLGELRQSLEQQTAMADVLGLINGSSGDIGPVFDAMVEKARLLCDAPFGALFSSDGKVMQAISDVMSMLRRVPDFEPDSQVEAFFTQPIAIPAETELARVLREGRTTQQNLSESGGYRSRVQLTVYAVERLGIRTMLMVPLVSEHGTIGLFTLYRREIRPFTDNQVALVEAFAQQAVVAMENARLLSELREALDQQTANAEVLQVINASPGNLAPVFEAILEKAMQVCHASFGGFWTFDAGRYVAAALYNLPQSYSEFLSTTTLVPGPGTAPHRFLHGERSIIQNVDLAAEEPYRAGDPQRRALVDLGGARTALQVPLCTEDAVFGVVTIYRQEVQAFDERQIALLQSFAAQAVIAIQNARLLSELRDRQAELRVTFDNMGDGVAMFDAEPRLAAWNRNFEEIIGLPAAILAERPSYADYLRMLAERGEFGTENVEGELASRLEDTARELRLERTRADGSVIEVRRNAVPGGGFVLIYSDVTEQRRAEAAIRAARDDAEAALERQTATADILKVIASSPTDVQPVLDAVAKAALRLCGAEDVLISLRDRDEWLIVGHEGPIRHGVTRRPLNRGTAPGRAMIDGTIVHLPDIPALDPAEFGPVQEFARREGFKAVLGAPMLREGVAVGAISLRRSNSGAFTPRQIELLESFAAQAVIAIENVRLFTELRESLEQQTASAEILRVISESPTDVEPALKAVAAAARRFCNAHTAGVILREGEEIVGVATDGPLDVEAYGRRFPLHRGTVMGRSIIDGHSVHVPDMRAADPNEYPLGRALSLELGHRATLAAPLIREGSAIGCIVLRKPEPDGFTSRQIELVETFAAQAVIAIQNVRLFTELRESLEQQTATSEILRAISQSPTNVQPVLEAVVKAAVRFCGATDAMIQLRDGDSVISRAHEGPLTFSADVRRSLDRSAAGGRAIVDGQTCHLPEVETLDPADFATLRKLAAQHGFRATVAAPLKREDTAIGAVVLRKVDPGPFTPQQIDLLETFAAQAVIAIENVRLFTELRDSLERLKAAQANLIQAEKMASLGQLTAGIAHEIKNPLNFVNNFAVLSSELLDELKKAVDALLAEPDEDRRAELQETMDLLTGNLAKIAEHGRRADGIVKSMLAHSRGGTGDWQVSNINGLVDEALNLAYHGARAQDQDFNVTLERDFATGTTPIEVVPQDVTRVFLNLFGNGFYAARKRELTRAGSNYRPTLMVSTRDLGDAVEIRVRDNGTGIPTEVRAKLFQPFFTTKPTGEGTGLGLSISYDIVTQQHGGSIEVESEPGSFTEFTVRLPRRRRAA